MVDEKWLWNEEDTGDRHDQMARYQPPQPTARHGVGFDGEKFVGGWGTDTETFVDTLLNPLRTLARASLAAGRRALARFLR